MGAGLPVFQVLGQPFYQGDAALAQDWLLRRTRQPRAIHVANVHTTQVSGRNNISFEQWMRMDLDYIDHWSFGGDLSLLLRTLPAVLASRGAY